MARRERLSSSTRWAQGGRCEGARHVRYCDGQWLRCVPGVHLAPPTIETKPEAAPSSTGDSVPGSSSVAMWQSNAAEGRGAPLVVVPLDSTPDPLAYEAPTQGERLAVYVAVSRCRRVSMRRADLWLVLALVREERRLGTPDRMLTAAACHESALGSPDVVGDGGRAVGALQLHPWAVAYCWAGEDRRADPVASARCLWRRTLVVAAKVRRRCDMLKGRDARWVAWGHVTAGRERTGGYACGHVGDHEHEAGL